MARLVALRLRTSGSVLVLALLLSGCGSVDNWLRGRTPPEQPGDDVILGAPDAGSYLDELQRLVAGDPFTQVDIHADAESAATLTPNPSTRLRYALILATPGHAANDPDEAASLLRELLAETELMTRREIALATIYLKLLDQQLVLEAETRRLASERTTAESAEQRATAARIADVEAENERLRRTLYDVEQKLEALTSIERSIRSQDEENGN